MRSYTNNKKVSHSKLKIVVESEFVEFFPLGPLHEVKWIQMEDRKYQKGLFILQDGSVYEINRIFIQNSKHYMSVFKYCFCGIDKFVNGVKIKKLFPDVSSMIEIQPHCPVLYEKKNWRGKLFIN